MTGCVRAEDGTLTAEQLFPETREVAESIPEMARRFLNQALASLHAPDGAVMLAASAVDAMLKAKNYAEGSLYGRINKAAEEHVVTQDMAKWAHQVRLDANDPRHADPSKPPPDEKDAERSVEFALALAEFLFVLPARVTRGLQAASGGA